MSSSDDLALPQSAVLLKSTESAACHGTIVAGYDFDKYGIDYERLLDSYMTTGYQATNLAIAIEIVNRMIADRQRQPIIVDGISTTFDYPVGRAKTGCTIFLGYTSNLVSCGLREIICYLAKHNMIDCLVTSAGGIEEDLIKCLAPTYLGGFSMSDAQLRSDGINRIGNLLVPNDNYCQFEDWLMPILDQCLDEQQKTNFNWTPSKLIRRLGQAIDNESSIYYWAYRNNIPVYCPALTDGSLGDMLYFHSYKNPGLRLDIIEDVRNINNMAVKSTKSGAIILGGGLVKHHINNANLMRNGSDYVVYVNTGQEFDGSDSGARPEEAVSWGKIKSTAEHVKVHADATLVFPLIVAKTFAKQQQRNL